MAGARYFRFTLFAFFILIVIFFISSSSTPKSINEAHSLISNQLSAIQGKPQGPPPPPSLDHSQQQLPSNDALHSDEVKQDAPAPAPAAAHQAPPPPPPPTTPNNHKSLPPAIVAGERANATFITLARNSDVTEIAKSIRNVEDRFNRKFGYDWVFLNDEPFDDNFRRVTTAMVSGKTHYGVIPKEQWSYPEWIDKDKAAETRKTMADQNVIYGGSESYRHMCRFESGFFFRHPLLAQFKYYWRVEPSIQLFCDVDYDAFKWMADNKKRYSFVLSLFEYENTIPTLWNSVKGFMREFPQHIAPDNSMAFLSDDGGDTYNRCHFWSNFEIGDLDWLRSQAYIDFFTKLDQDGGFFYERWGDAPVHSIAAGLLLPKEEIHFFEDIAYYHVPFTHCPNSEQDRLDKKCLCNPDDNFDWNGYSCLPKFYKLHDMQIPAGVFNEVSTAQVVRVFLMTVLVISLLIALLVLLFAGMKKRTPNYGI